MARPCDALGWYVVCDCGMSWPYSLLLDDLFEFINQIEDLTQVRMFY